MKLTATNIGTLGPGEYFDEGQVRKLFLRVRASGARSWAVRYSFRGQGRRYTLGEVKLKPTDEGLTLKAARDAALAVLARVAQGEDPQAQRIAERRAPPPLPEVTVAALAREMLAHLQLRPNTKRVWTRTVDVEIIPTFGELPASKLTKRHIREWTDRIAANTPSMANRAFDVLRRCYSLGIERDIITATPFGGLRRPSVYVPRDRVLSTDELWAVQRALEHWSLKDAADVVRMLLWTGVRREMALGARRSDFEQLDGAEPRWAIPGERTKNAADHVVPLPKQAAELVRRRLAASRTGYLFPQRKRGKGRAAQPYATWTQQQMTSLRKLVAKAMGKAVPDWTLHDLRRAMATHLSEDLHVPDDVIALILGHTPDVGPKVTRKVYQRAKLLKPRRDALQAWADWLERIPDPSKKVLPFKDADHR